MSYISKDIYEGEWLDDKKHGRGFVIYSNGAKYDGNFVGGRKEGKIIFIFIFNF